tara:strand:- start:2991 stop:4319 length:1329 start_codon:yes stop_codon:yes gene_type:complete
MAKPFQLRDYQIELAELGFSVLTELHIVYLCMEVRVGKTLTALQIAKLYGAKDVHFLTKIDAMPDIKKDYKDGKFSFNLTVINDESMHTISDVPCDLVIHDEHHRFAAFPKMGKQTKYFKEHYGHLPMIFLSGTPHPESYSQIFHQFHVSNNSPFDATNFYSYFKKNALLKTKIKKSSGFAATDYSMAPLSLEKFISALEFPPVVDKHISEYLINYNNQKIAEVLDIIGPYFIRFTQAQAGFTTKVNETILLVKMKPITYELCNRLKKTRVIDGGGQVILGDTAVKMQQKLHQMYSGSVKFESGDSFMFDNTKAEFIKKKFKGKRIGIFYKFKEELAALKTVFDLTTDVEAFNRLEYDVIAKQFLAGREGISLHTADLLVYYNIDFSAVTYWQSRDRLTTKERTENEVYWIFSEGGIEEKIYRSVCDKKNYTVQAFKKDYNF